MSKAVRRDPKTAQGLAPFPLLVLLLSACAGRYEAVVEQDLAAQAEQRDSAQHGASDNGSQRISTLDEVAQHGQLGGYVALALQHNPEIQAAFERWSASVHRVSRARRLPEPSLSFGYFLRSVETRVGPQQARLSLQQAFPWPSKLSAGADASSAQARALQRRFEAQALSVRQRVAAAYWSLWQVRATRVLQAQQLELVHSMSESVRGRMATGATSLADVQQLDLSAARLEDDILGLNESELSAQAQLCAELGLECDRPLSTTQPPAEAQLPTDEQATLMRAAAEHPLLSSTELMAQAADASARVEAADRLPSFTVGADWIITGQAAAPNVADTGKDAVIVGAGLRLPLWQGSYSDSIEAAKADARAQRAERRAQLTRARAGVVAALSSVRDSVRRVKLYRDTLVPQAESAYESVLGAYTVGHGSAAQVLMAQRDLLELRVMLESSRADYARAWARLEEVTGRELDAHAVGAGAGDKHD